MVILFTVKLPGMSIGYVGYNRPRANTNTEANILIGDTRSVHEN